MSATRPAGSAARVLIVEDDETIREAVSAALGGAGYEVRAVVDGRDLETALAGFRPDVVLVDVMLPGRNGFALLEVVRSHTDAGVLMLTARDGVADRLRGLDSGADDYIVKPFVLAELVARVAAVLRRLGRIPSTARGVRPVQCGRGALVLRAHGMCSRAVLGWGVGYPTAAESGASRMLPVPPLPALHPIRRSARYPTCHGGCGAAGAMSSLARTRRAAHHCPGRRAAPQTIAVRHGPRILTLLTSRIMMPSCGPP